MWTALLVRPESVGLVFGAGFDQFYRRCLILLITPRYLRRPSADRREILHRDREYAQF